MSDRIFQRVIWNCNRDTEGRLRYCDQACLQNKLSKAKIDLRKSMPRHWFLITSKKPTEEFVTAFPITSKPRQVELNGGETLKDGEMCYFSQSLNKLPFNTNETLVLCNKLCRIPIWELTENKDYGMVKKSRYDHFILIAQSFLRPS